MKITHIIGAFLLFGCMLGCAGSHSSRPSLTSIESGARLSFKVKWPATTREIPPDTQSIAIKVYDAEGALRGNLTLPRGTTTGRMEGMPSGKLVVQAVANGAEKILASGETEVSVLPQKDNPVSLSLTPVPEDIDDDRYVLGGTVSIDPDDPSMVRIALNAIINSEDGRPILGLDASNFSVYEDGVHRTPITVEQNSDGTGARSDILFIVDSTGSMSEEIDGVKNSVVAFADDLAAAGIDVGFAGVEYGDEVRTSIGLTTNVNDFKSWVGGLRADGGDDFPENPLDAIAAGLSIPWRPGAQRIIVVLTDATVHEGDSITSLTMDSLGASLRGTYIVHTISPGGGGLAGLAPLSGLRDNYGRPVSALTPNRDISLLASITGGKALQMPGNGVVDLKLLGINDLIKAGYIVRFKSLLAEPPRERLIRLLVAQGGINVADQLFPGRY